MTINNSSPIEMVLPDDPGRRRFIAQITKLTGGAFLVSQPLFDEAGSWFNRSWTVEQVMELFIKEVPGAPFERTVDTLKAGKPGTIVKGIVTTMFATLEVIQKAIGLGANFIIAHEPSFYNHSDETAWLQHDEVYQYKKELLQKHDIAVWRNHDYIHQHLPDGVLEGLMTQLDWKIYQDPTNKNIVSLPGLTLEELIKQVKSTLGITMVRYIGDISQVCRKILVLPGAYGGRRHIEAIGATKPDVLVCGEIQEWETAEYIRDAQTKGQKLALVILGHVLSEEPGSAYLANWLKEILPGMPVTHIPSKNPLMFL